MRDFKCMFHLDYNLHNEISILSEWHFTLMFILFTHCVCIYIYDTLYIHSFLQSYKYCRMTDNVWNVECFNMGLQTLKDSVP